MGYGVTVAKDAPDFGGHRGTEVAELAVLHLLELRYQVVRYLEILTTIFAGRLIFVAADALSKELRHLEIRVSQEGGDLLLVGYDLGIEGATTVAYEDVGMRFLTDCSDIIQGGVGRQWQVWSEDFRLGSEAVTQCYGHRATARGKEAVEE